MVVTAVSLLRRGNPLASAEHQRSILEAPARVPGFDEKLRAASLPPLVTTRNDGVQRYGEAVVRQMLGATFVREEPYEPPTRFS